MQAPTKLRDHRAVGDQRVDPGSGLGRSQRQGREGGDGISPPWPSRAGDCGTVACSGACALSPWCCSFVRLRALATDSKSCGAIRRNCFHVGAERAAWPGGRGSMGVTAKGRGAERCKCLAISIAQGRSCGKSLASNRKLASGAGRRSTPRRRSLPCGTSRNPSADGSRVLSVERQVYYTDRNRSIARAGKRPRVNEGHAPP